MFANIRRHQKWLWILISGAVIISFVWYFNPNSQQGAGSVMGFEQSVGTINGRSINRNEYLAARREAELQYLFRYGTWHGSDDFSRQNPDFIDRETKTRLVLKDKITEHNIHVTDGEVAKWIFEAFGRDKPYTEADLERFIKQTLEPHGLREGDLMRFVRGEVAIGHLINVAGVAGRLVTPQEAEVQYRRENEQASAEAVIFTATNFVAQVNADPAAIGQYYTNEASSYRVAKRVQLTYVPFAATNYFTHADTVLAGISNFNARIDEVYLARGASFFTDTNGAVMAPENAKQKIRDDERTRIALVEARKAANAFAEELLAMTGPKDAANLEKLAAAKGLVLKTTEPFTQFEGPREMDVPERFNQIAFALTPAEPFIEEPIVGNDEVYVVAFKNELKSEIPPLDTIRDRVVEDYKRSQSQTLARQAGQAFYAKLTNSIAGGKTFSAAAAELGQPVVTLVPFTQVSRSILGLPPGVDSSAVKNVAFATKEGETSTFTMTRDGGFVLHVKKFVPVADDMVKSALPAYLANLQKSGMGEAFGAWFNKEFQDSKIALITDSKAPGEGEGAGAPE